MKYVKVALLIALICSVLSKNSIAGETSTLIKSIAFPGMGQLSEGKKLKGFVLMGAEVVFLSLAVNELSHQSSYAFKTRELSYQFQRSQNFYSALKNRTEWEETYNKCEFSQKMFGVYAGLAILTYSLNIADVVFFTSSDEDRESHLRGNENIKIVLTQDDAIGAKFILSF